MLLKNPKVRSPEIISFRSSVLKKSQAIVIFRSPWHSCAKTFNVVHYSKSIIGINTKLGILADHDKVQLQGKGHNSKIIAFKVMPLASLTKNFK